MIKNNNLLGTSDKFLFKRISRFHPMDFRFFSKYKNRATSFYKACGIPSKILRYLNLPNPGFNPAENYYYGSQWIALNLKQIKFLLKSFENMRKEFRFTYAPDELAFHSILARASLADVMLSQDDPIRKPPFHVINQNLSQEWTLEKFLRTEFTSSWFIRRPCHEIIHYLETEHGV